MPYVHCDPAKSCIAKYLRCPITIPAISIRDEHIFTKDNGCDGDGVSGWLEAAAELSGAEAEAIVALAVG